MVQMELMSSLLLCALALLPQTSGKAGIKHQPLDIKFNNTLSIQQKPILRKAIFLNINAPPLVSNISQIQAAFNDVQCRKCHDCMERAIKTFKTFTHVIHSRPSAEHLQEDLLTNEIRYRTKRDAQPTDQTAPETTVETAAESVSETKTTKKVKARRNKSVTVTKYNMGGEVYALRVKETQMVLDPNGITKPVATCQVYNVKKSYPCDSAEAEALLVNSRRRVNKRKGRRQERESPKPSSDPATTTAQSVKLHTSSYKKREVDNSHIPETFMPSIEDLYS